LYISFHFLHYVYFVYDVYNKHVNKYNSNKVCVLNAIVVETCEIGLHMKRYAFSPSTIMGFFSNYIIPG